MKFMNIMREFGYHFWHYIYMPLVTLVPSFCSSLDNIAFTAEASNKNQKC
ncbi:hypothetical protein RchiOBHm_Chr6g0245971 [Rosa chinensis]|uniref:Uncharacterized protein n=1 Tax=Rosa chinensis TaxID=74649 RepID=A0A2P6PJE1_ROSCH|nr:hypothetical protein RchiOBHm_Chr6g0245971 [Rosa chinensis]